MNSIRIISAAECPMVPWKNGGGMTREIAIFPPDADMDNFGWRLSAAKVDYGGPFSTFSGIRRKLAVIEGVLHLSGPDTDILLNYDSPPAAFDGDTHIIGDPVGGPALDLNAMARAGQHDCTMERLFAGDVAQATGTSFLFALEPQMLGGNALKLYDCAEFTGHLRLYGRAILVRFTSA